MKNILSTPIIEPGALYPSGKPLHEAYGLSIQLDIYMDPESDTTAILTIQRHNLGQRGFRTLSVKKVV